MNKLKCKVDTCRHNKSNLCDLKKIDVDGPAATESCQTCCISYVERNATAENTTGSHAQADDKTEIHCSAEHCTYNENKKCAADCVCVSCTCAAPCVVSETQCSTFVTRA